MKFLLSPIPNKEAQNILPTHALIIVMLTRYGIVQKVINRLLYGVIFRPDWLVISYYNR